VSAGSGSGGTILHFDGRAWSRPAPITTSQVFEGIAGTGPDDVWNVGYGEVWHWNGRRRGKIAPPISVEIAGRQFLPRFMAHVRPQAARAVASSWWLL
jgi:hypothetical protein